MEDTAEDRETEYYVNYLACQSCEAKANCSVCDSRLTEDLMKLPGITAVHPHMQQKRIELESTLSEFDLLDLLESVGIFEQ